jgi:hypothetical protein
MQGSRKAQIIPKSKFIRRWKGADTKSFEDHGGVPRPALDAPAAKAS